MSKQLDTYRKEVAAELDNILSWWATHTVDELYGGFIGRVNNANETDATAVKGSVLNSRILWSFSAGYLLTKNERYLQLAERAYRYIADCFIDREYGGVYWTVDNTGKPADTKKQIYALSFAVYGLSEYYLASGNEAAKTDAIALYHDIAMHSYDAVNGGFIEALTRNWEEIADLRLSAKDANEKKSMNTHLHVLEGFANLYRIWPDVGLRAHIAELITLFTERIIDKTTYHLLLFFGNEWQVKSQTVSYGHDIEAAWLVQEAAEIIQDDALLKRIQPLSLAMADAASRGLDTDGGLWYEFEPADAHLLKEKHWWPQAEAMVGYFNAWQLSGKEAYLNASLSSWAFIQQHLLDKTNGEWFWGVREDYAVMPGEDKAGLWKCPYHNSRACIEIMKRIQQAPI
ncbi:mannobiose 2-epimerase [Filimonas zeae]|uniref:Cellobiose 2-epimerase n=1 Tax=Filimonas zeae TaxID=1737353 RepID=A0A917IQT6_9BACT|nr:AGE family epimerase/isomerase [Filimonas zeae]MDR6337544.1 mannobiose 2-epimerase [Filimonas zeae]GGH59128.1 cellobiose 2-epimerase [Filimonas zeae]